tara:strand:- start:6322 stop:6777 length:456 start_codon:yes stop_codon:yes gene_type:complete
MPRPPAKNYYQTTGRRHLGLSHPERYGLTYIEVVRLIDEDRWRIFYTKWRRKQKQIKEISALKHVCPNCNNKVEDPSLWILAGTQCKKCEKINSHNIRVVAGKEAGLAGRSRGPGKRVLGFKNFCSICRKWKENTLSLGKIRACESCIKKA